ncbi:hypothetical protein [Nostoc sp.]
MNNYNTFFDEDDEFGGATVDINQLKQRANILSVQLVLGKSYEDDEFGGATVDINQLKQRAKSIRY